MTVSVEVVAPRDGAGVIKEGDVYYRVCMDDGWEPQPLDGNRDVIGFTRHWSDFQAVEGVEFASMDEAIQYVRRKSLDAYVRANDGLG